VATTGALVHLVHQGLMKITLFFCAGNLAETLGLHRVSELHGVGRRMPLTASAFTVAALGMIGVPPVAGFVSKWYLGTGGLAAGEGWVVPVLATSTVLNAAYFLPILRAMWFDEGPDAYDERRPRGRAETSLALLVPCLATAVLSLLAGPVAGAPLTPLRLVGEIVRDLYP
jgi:formate hydrogenlyase subunit 3/multisubunit Na+/H+ antiporter MnhD subunit